MRLFDSLLVRIAALFERSRMNAEMEEELRSHIEHRADDLERSGIPPAQAARRARIEFGGREKYKEEIHEALGGNFLDVLFGDVRFALRALRKSPGFLFAAVFTLALAIGANAMVFAILNGLILRPLNVPDAHSLYVINNSDDDMGDESYPDYLDLRERNRSFEDLAAFNTTEPGVDFGKGSSRTWSYEVTGNYFDMLGIQPNLGRFFHPSDEHGSNSAPFVVLTYAYWHSVLQDDRTVVGRKVLINKHPFTVIGVAPPGFFGTMLIFRPSFFVPIVDEELLDGQNLFNARGNRWLSMLVGHLKPGVKPAQASADLSMIEASLVAAYPKDEKDRKLVLVSPALGGQLLGNPTKAFLAGLMLLASLILLAACANLGSLFAARSADRAKEVALRLALGSTRKRILRALFTETLLVSFAGGTAGLLASVVLLRGLSTWQPFPQFPIALPVNPDASVYVVAFVLALASGLLSGAVPVRQVLRTNPYEVVKSGSAAKTGKRITLRDALLAVQIAICAVLVTSSMVAVRGLLRSMHSKLGIDPQNALLVETDLGIMGYKGDQVPEMQRRMIDSIGAIPGVERVGLIDSPPLFIGCCSDSVVFTGQTTDLRPANAAGDAQMMDVSPGYFQTARTALLIGRDFTWHDDKNAPRVAIINEELARRVFGSAEEAVGQFYKMPDGRRIQVVGVVEDGKYVSNLADENQQAMFFPLLQNPSSETFLVVRSNRDAQVLGATIRRSLTNLDPGFSPFLQPWIRTMDGALFAPRVASVSLGALGLMGAMLSITGIFGLAAYSVSKRLRELGIRVALGAKKTEVLKAALGRAIKLLAIGSAAGLILGLLATRVLALVVYEATPRDPLVLAGVVLAMALLGLLATWIPAQRALSVDPLILLREE